MRLIGRFLNEPRNAGCCCCCRCRCHCESHNDGPRTQKGTVSRRGTGGGEGKGKKGETFETSHEPFVRAQVEKSRKSAAFYGNVRRHGWCFCYLEGFFYLLSLSSGRGPRNNVTLYGRKSGEQSTTRGGRREGERDGKSPTAYTRARSRAERHSRSASGEHSVLSDKTDNRPAFIRLRLHFVNSYGCLRLSVIYETRALRSIACTHTVPRVGKHRDRDRENCTDDPPKMGEITRWRTFIIQPSTLSASSSGEAKNRRSVGSISIPEEERIES